MREMLLEWMQSYMRRYSEERGAAFVWRTPVIKFADAHDPRFAELRRIVDAEHFMPQDFLPGAGTVASYFLPFTKELGKSNAGGYYASEEWANAYLATNDMAAEMNRHLVQKLVERGEAAAAPEPGRIGIISDDKLWSRWSQRHVAWIAGHGTFGLNNMLISEAGCCGRYFSFVLERELPAGVPPVKERCLYKRDGRCAVCAGHCETGALGKSGFNRKRCYVMCMENDSRYPGADVCGKCVVGLPCSFTAP